MRQIVNEIKRRLSLMIGRAILIALDNTTSTQLMKLKCLRGEVLPNIEKIEDFGFASYPPVSTEDTEAIVIFPGGKRDQGIGIKVYNKGVRPAGLNEGDVCVFNQAGDKIWLKNSDRKITIDASSEVNIQSGTKGAARDGDSVTIPFSVTSNPLWHAWFLAINAVVPGYPGLAGTASMAGSINSGSTKTKVG